MSRLHRPAFSMTGLLVVLAILLFLGAMLLPAIAQVRRAAARTQSVNNLKHIGVGIHAHHDVYKRFPALVGKSHGVSGTLFMQILPFVEQERLYQDGAEDWTKIMGHAIPVYIDPQDATAPPENRYRDWLATTSYAGNWLVFGENGRVITDITDGSSNTIGVAQRYQVCGEEPTGWAYNRLHYRAPLHGFYSQARFQLAPGPKECDPTLPQAIDPMGITTLFCDGTVRIIRDGCSPQTWSYLNTPDGGEVTDVNSD